MSTLLRMGVFGFAAVAGGHLVFAASPTVLDQSFISGDGAPLFSDVNEGFEFVAQTFTAGVSGELDGIEIALRTLEGATSRLNVAIRTAFNQIPQKPYWDQSQ